MPVEKLAINLDHYFDKKLFYSVRLCWCTETALISKICADAKRTLKVMAGIVRYSRQLFLLNSRMIRSLTHSFLGVKFSIFSDYLSMKLGYSVIFDVLKFLATIKNLLIIKLKNYQTQPTLTAKEHNLSKKRNILLISAIHAIQNHIFTRF